MVRMEVASSWQDHLPTVSTAITVFPTTVYPVCGDLIVVLDRNRNFRTFPTHQISFLVAERSMPALLLRILLQCAGDIEMCPGPEFTPTPKSLERGSSQYAAPEPISVYVAHDYQRSKVK